MQLLFYFQGSAREREISFVCRMAQSLVVDEGGSGRDEELTTPGEERQHQTTENLGKFTEERDSRNGTLNGHSTDPSKEETEEASTTQQSTGDKPAPAAKPSKLKELRGKVGLDVPLAMMMFK